MTTNDVNNTSAAAIIADVLPVSSPLDIIVVNSQQAEEQPVDVEVESSEYFLAMFMLIR